MVERAREAVVPPLGHASDVVHDIRFLVVVVDVEVRRLQGLEVEVFPLDLVAPEILRVAGESEEKENGREKSNASGHRVPLERVAAAASRLPCKSIRSGIQPSSATPFAVMLPPRRK